MPDTSQLIALGGHHLWAYAVAGGDEVRVRLPLDDWERSGLAEGRRVPVRIGDRPDRWPFVAGVAELPPVVWVTLAPRLGR
ncbi:MAG: hypothetical protein C0501_27070 [Isosphaera sp.]|nr:hypothetical protein [Isosphaera sp.]